MCHNYAFIFKINFNLICSFFFKENNESSTKREYKKQHLLKQTKRK